MTGWGNLSCGRLHLAPDNEGEDMESLGKRFNEDGYELEFEPKGQRTVDLERHSCELGWDGSALVCNCDTPGAFALVWPDNDRQVKRNKVKYIAESVDVKKSRLCFGMLLLLAASLQGWVLCRLAIAVIPLMFPFSALILEFLEAMCNRVSSWGGRRVGACLRLRITLSSCNLSQLSWRELHILT